MKAPNSTSNLDEAAEFLDRLADHVAPLKDPADAVTEAVAFTLEQLLVERYLGLLLTGDEAPTHARGVTSETAMAFGRSILDRFSVDWETAGYDDSLLTELVEHMLRTVQSLVLDPVGRARNGVELREYLRRWVGIPALLAPRSGRPDLVR